MLPRSRVPFSVHSRLYWYRNQRSWFARRPEAFTGKVHWKLLKDRRPLLTVFADKVAARDYVARVVGPEFLTECYAVADDPLEIDRSTLPREYVAKVSHGCGGVWIVGDQAPPELTVVPGFGATEPLWPGSGWNMMMCRPAELDWELLVRAFRVLLGQNYGRLSAEWAYLRIPPRVLVEELLAGPDGDLPPDYRFFVFNGRVRLIQVGSGRLRPRHINVLLPDWTPVDACATSGDTRYPPGPAQPPPPALEQMVEVAEALAQETDFVRVDLYNIAGRIVFGELTNYPGAGDAGFDPQSFDVTVGSWWTLPRRYR